jgi:hypothetical protein
MAATCSSTLKQMNPFHLTKRHPTPLSQTIFPLEIRHPAVLSFKEKLYNESDTSKAIPHSKEMSYEF